jgi:hypothetical protein
MTIQLEQFQSGRYEKGYEYRYFVPSHINDEWVWQTSQINALLEKAAVKLGELNSFARLVPNMPPAYWFVCPQYGLKPPLLWSHATE